MGLKIKLMSQWFGPLPPWYPKFCERVAANEDLCFLLITDQETPKFSVPRCRTRTVSMAKFVNECNSVLIPDGVTPCPVMDGFRLGVLRPAFGEVYGHELQGFDWWGWCDLDIVIGNLANFTRLYCDNFDLVSFWGKVAGEFMLLRNTPEMVGFWRAGKPWELGWPTAFVEHNLSLIAPNYRYAANYIHGHDNGRVCWMDGDRLMCGPTKDSGGEIPYFHFNRGKAWPM